MLASLLTSAADAASAIRSGDRLGPAVTVSKASGKTTLSTSLPVTDVGAHVLRLTLSEPYRTAEGDPLFQVRGEGQLLVDSAPVTPTTIVDFPVDVLDGQLDVLLDQIPNRVRVQGIEAIATGPAPSGPAAPTDTTDPDDPDAGQGETFPPGTPLPPVGASFTAPVCNRRYEIPGLVSSATSGDNLIALNTAIAAALPGDCLLIPAGTYRRSGNVDVPATKSDITIIGAGRDRTILLGTNLDKHGLRILGAKNIRVESMTLDTVTGGSRTGLNQAGHATLLLDPGTVGFAGQDLLLRGARAAGFFAYRASKYHLNRVEVERSLADAFHNTNGSSDGICTDCVATAPGDDGWAMVAYGGSAATVPHDFVVTRFRMQGNPNGRGFGIVNAYGLTVNGPTLIEDTSAAGILIARETQYGGTYHPVRDIRFLGETTINRANHNREDHGAVLIDNPEPSQPVEGVYLESLNITDTGANRTSMPSHNIYVKGSGRIEATLKDFRFYGSGPKSLFGGSRTADSVVDLIGWSPTDGYR